MFHLRNGFFFERLDDGSVRIRYAQPVIDEFGNPAAAVSGGYFKAVIAQVTVPENEWASVLASVCAAGETSETWQAARDYHATGGSNPASSRVGAGTEGAVEAPPRGGGASLASPSCSETADAPSPAKRPS